MWPALEGGQNLGTWRRISIFFFPQKWWNWVHHQTRSQLASASMEKASISDSCQALVGGISQVIRSKTWRARRTVIFSWGMSWGNRIKKNSRVGIGGCDWRAGLEEVIGREGGMMRICIAGGSELRKDLRALERWGQQIRSRWSEVENLFTRVIFETWRCSVIYEDNVLNKAHTECMFSVMSERERNVRESCFTWNVDVWWPSVTQTVARHFLWTQEEDNCLKGIELEDELSLVP